MIAKKKTKKADLERKRFAFFQIGLIVSGALCLAAFEYTSIQFAELEKKQIEDYNPMAIFDKPMVDIIFKEKPVSQKKAVIKIITEVTPSNKPVVETNPIINPGKINIDVPDWGEGDGDGDIIVTTGIDSTYEFPETWPEFPGGDAAMKAWIGNNINIPYYAESLNGTVYVRFVVDKDGSIQNVTLGKGIHTDYDKASLAVVSKMPRWTPGEQAGKKVKVQYDLPIKFVGR